MLTSLLSYETLQKVNAPDIYFVREAHHDEGVSLYYRIDGCDYNFVILEFLHTFYIGCNPFQSEDSRSFSELSDERQHQIMRVILFLEGEVEHILQVHPQYRLRYLTGDLTLHRAKGGKGA